MDPESNEYKRIVNTESEIARLTAINERDYEYERLFEERRTAERAAHKTIGNECQTRSITQPVPGGVGPMTIAMLMYNCVSAIKQE